MGITCVGTETKIYKYGLVHSSTDPINGSLFNRQTIDGGRRSQVCPLNFLKV